MKIDLKRAVEVLDAWGYECEEITSLLQQLTAAKEEITLDEQRVADLMGQVGELSNQLSSRDVERQKKLDSESIPWHQKVGTVVPFSKTADKDPWPNIPLSVPQESPIVIEAWAWVLIAGFVGLAYWWVAA